MSQRSNTGEWQVKHLHPFSYHHRYIERLKARNERLAAALERKKGETEQIRFTLNRLESDHLALLTALRYWYNHTAAHFAV